MNDPYCLRPDELTALLAGAPWRRVVAMGDSIAAGIGDPAPGYVDRSWPERLTHALHVVGRELPAYLNLGEVGARTAEIRRRQLRRALAFGPDLAIVTAGINDAFRRSFTAAEVEAELDAIVGPLTGAGALVVTFGCFDMSRTSFLPLERRAGLSERLHALGELTANVSQRHGGLHVDFLRHSEISDDLLSADGLHINGRGHAIVATELTRALGRHLIEHADAVRR